MAQAITLSEFRQALLDPNYAVGYIIANNPEAVADNLRNMGFIVSTPDDIIRALNALLERGDQALFIQALTVELNQERVTPEEMAVIAEQADAMLRAAGQKSTGAAQGGNFNWAALMGGLATGALFFLNSSGQNQVNPTNPTNPNTPPPPPKSNAGLYIGIGIGVVVLIIILLLVFRKK